jgi:hypothetical protein
MVRHVQDVCRDHLAVRVAPGGRRNPQPIAVIAADDQANALRKAHSWLTMTLVIIDAMGNHSDRTFVLEDGKQNLTEAPSAVACAHIETAFRKYCLPIPRH